MDGKKFLPGLHPHLLLSGYFLPAGDDHAATLVTEFAEYLFHFENGKIVKDLLKYHGRDSKYEKHTFRFELEDEKWKIKGCHPLIGLEEVKTRAYCFRFACLQVEEDTETPY